MKKYFIVFLFSLVFGPVVSGEVTWLRQGIRLDTGDAPGAFRSHSPQIACASDRVYVVWEDTRAGNSDINFNVGTIIGEVALLTLEAGPGGTTDPLPGSYQQELGEEIDITALPSEHFRFHHWSGDLSGFNNPGTVVMDSDKFVTAHFARIVYAPLDFSGKRVQNRGLSLSEFIDVLNWHPNPLNQDILRYRVYLEKGGVLTFLSEVSGQTPTYMHRRVRKDDTSKYVLIAIDRNESESSPSRLTITGIN